MSARNTTPAFARGGVDESAYVLFDAAFLERVVARSLMTKPDDMVCLDREGNFVAYIGGGNSIGFKNVIAQGWQKKYPGNSVILVPNGTAAGLWMALYGPRSLRHHPITPKRYHP